jgi:hypothetical protein
MTLVEERQAHARRGRHRRKYFSGRRGISIHGDTYTPGELIALIEEHLRALAEVDDLTVRRSMAVAKERAVLARVEPILSALKSLVSSEFERPPPSCASSASSRTRSRR